MKSKYIHENVHSKLLSIRNYMYHSILILLCDIYFLYHNHIYISNIPINMKGIILSPSFVSLIKVYIITLFFSSKK